VGTQAIIMAKCLALLCKQAVTGPHRWQEVRTWFTYTLALALVAIGTFWVRSLNKGLRMVRFFPSVLFLCDSHSLATAAESNRCCDPSMDDHDASADECTDRAGRAD
jgi:hypothetical protein